MSIREQLTIRRAVLAMALVILVAGLAAQVIALDNQGSGRQYQVTDDLSNSGSYDGAPIIPLADPMTFPGHGVGQGNNGHGNNEDGVDSSNPGQGPGQLDPSCGTADSCVDDETRHSP